MYVLHYAPDNASLIIRLALEHRGLAYRAELVDRAAQAQRSAAYLRLNPNGLIPAMETPDGVIFETGAILLWLADRHGALAPAPDAAERGDFLKWFFFVSNTLHPGLRMLFYPEKYVGSDAGSQNALRVCLRRDLCAYFEKLDKVAADRPSWFGAPDPGILDFYVAAALRWCALYPAMADRSWFDLASYPNLHAICARLDTLPCTQALRTAEGMGAQPFTHPDYPNPPEGSAT